MENPFVIAGNIPARYFCDRREESAKIIRTLANGGNLCLMSPRRMGKSKLIQFCYDQPSLAEDYYTFYVDILHTTGLRELAYALGQKVFGTLHSRSLRMFQAFVQGLKSINAKFGFDPTSNTPTFSIGLGDITQPAYTLAEIFDCLEKADKPCIVAIDEFQQIAKYPEKNVEALLRARVQQLSNVHFVFAGSERHLVSEMFLSSARPFYNSVSIMELRAIAPAVYTDFVRNMYHEFERDIDAEDILCVYHQMEGNTYYMQKTFHEAFINTPANQQCDRTLLRATLENMLEEESAGYRLMLSRIPERQKELLYAIAAEGRAEKIMSSAFLRRHALASASAVQSAAKKLMELDLLTVEDGVYRIPDVMFRMYLQRLTQPDIIFLQ